jgi:DNA polymerase elongation subunit (family B)
VNPDADKGILPHIIENLINQRKIAKNRMKSATGVEK